MCDESALPLVTVAIPLYRSRRFLEVISENIRNLDYPNLEIIIGDRHVADDTVEQLRSQFGDDARLRFITADDRLPWTEHYNALLAAGAGEYFLWMPHDDSYPPGYVDALVARLEATPDAVLACGACDAERPGQPSMPLGPPPPLFPAERWSTRSALRLLLGWNLGIAMRGAFRRAPVVDAGLWLPETRGHAHADTCWLFGMACLGRFEFVPEAHCLKRFYPASTHARWNPLPPTELVRVLTGYLTRYSASKRERALGAAVLWFGAAVNRGSSLVNALAGRELIGRPAIQRMFRWLLSPRRRRSSSGD